MAMPVAFAGELNAGPLIFRGVISILFGVLALAWPGPGLLAIAVLYGAYAFTDGVFAIATGIRRSRRHESWALPIFEGILGVGAGVFTFFWPGLTLFVLSLIIGCWAVMSGVVEIGAAFKLKTIFPDASKTGRVLLGIGGAFSVLLGITIFAAPAVGIVALLTLVASYALIFGALMTGLGLRLRRDQRELHEEEAPTSRAA